MLEDRGPELAAILGLFLCLSWLFVLLRVYVKTTISKSWAPDDTLLIISLVIFTSYCTCAAAGVHHGTGRHLHAISESDIPKALRYWWICELLYTLTTVSVRISVAVFLLRLSGKPAHRYTIYGTMAMVCLFSTGYLFLIAFQCTPYSFFWSEYEGMKGSCIDPAIVPGVSIAHSVISFSADWVLGLLPVTIIWGLNLNRRSKVSVAGLLALGLLAGLATLIRIPFIRFLAVTDDFLYATLDVAIWSTIEPGLGIIAFAGATLRPLFRSFYGLTTRHDFTQSVNSRISRRSRGSMHFRLGDDGNGHDREWPRERTVARCGNGDSDSGMGKGESARKKGDERKVVSLREMHTGESQSTDDSVEAQKRESGLPAAHENDEGVRSQGYGICRWE